MWILNYYIFMSKKGIILAGGNGSRLDPLTRSVSKQLLPVYNKPLVYYPLSTLQQAGIEDILIITNCVTNSSNIKRAIGNTKSNIQYAVQPKPNGIAEAFIIAKDFIGNDDVTLILGDNIFHGNFPLSEHRNKIYGIQSNTPELYGCIQFDSRYNVTNIIEKPHPDNVPSSYVVPGIYSFDNTVVRKAETLQPSPRGELEITDLINLYIKEQSLRCDILPPNMVWFDCGNPDHLLEASNFVKAVEARSMIKIGSIS